VRRTPPALRWPARAPRRALLASLLAAPALAQPLPPLATAVALDLPDHHGLRPLGGLEISRERLGFGGLSGLHIAADLTLTAVSDIGYFAEFTLVLDAHLTPTGLAPRRAARLRDGAGRPLPRGRVADAEALARLPDGSFLVAFERWHRIRRYRDLDGPGEFAPAPPGIEQAPPNTGLEALAVLADGSWLAIAEEMAVPGHAGATAAWLRRAGSWVAFAWKPAPWMSPVDATPLPDGGALVLERGFSLLGGFSARIVRADPAALAGARTGSVLTGEEILRIAPPLPVDNYEAIAAFAHQGRLLLAILSDDNQSRLQRTLLLLFEMMR
jgi:hypothetical protein